MKSMRKFIFAAVAFVAMSTNSANAQDKVLTTLYVNKEVTTHLIMPETIRLVDISTDKVVGNQVNDNIVRVKPDTVLTDGETAAVVTVIGERHIAQYKLVYSVLPGIVHTRFTIPYSDTQEYINPDVSMSVAEMSRYAIRMSNAKRTVKNIHSKKPYLFGRRLLLHRLLVGEQDQDSIRYFGNSCKAGGQEAEEGH